MGSSGLRVVSDCSRSSRSSGRISAREHLAVLDHLLGLFARVDVDALDPVAQLGSRASLGAELALAGAEVEALALRDLVQERDPRLALVAREREADQDPDHDG